MSIRSIVLSAVLDVVRALGLNVVVIGFGGASSQTGNHRQQ